MNRIVNSNIVKW